MIIYIARHGDAEPYGQGAVDRERNLTEHGIAEVCQVAKRLAAEGECAEAILSSPFTRARQTAEIFHREWAIAKAIQFEDSIVPSSNVQLALQMILNLPYSSVLLTSHMPTVAVLVAELTQHQATPSFSTATVAKVHIEAGLGRLEKIVYP